MATLAWNSPPQKENSVMECVKNRHRNPIFKGRRLLNSTDGEQRWKREAMIMRGFSSFTPPYWETPNRTAVQLHSNCFILSLNLIYKYFMKLRQQNIHDGLCVLHKCMNLQRFFELVVVVDCLQCWLPLAKRSSEIWYMISGDIACKN